MKPDTDRSILVLSSLVNATIDAQTKAQLFRQSVTQLTLTPKTQTLSNRAIQTLKDLKDALPASLQQKPLFYS